jgi:hypothetical protein
MRAQYTRPDRRRILIRTVPRREPPERRVEVRPLAPPSSNEELGAPAGAVSSSGSAPASHLGYDSDVIEVVEAYLYRPAVVPLRALVGVVKRLQSGRLDAYLAYMLIALVALIALVVAFA